MKNMPIIKVSIMFALERLKLHSATAVTFSPPVYSFRFFCLFNFVLLGPIPLSYKVLLKTDKIFDILTLLLGISSCMRTSGKIVQRPNRDLIADDFALCSVLTYPSACANSRAELVILTPRLYQVFYSM